MVPDALGIRLEEALDQSPELRARVKESGAASGIAMIFIVPMMVFGTLLAVFDETTRTIAHFMPNFYVSDSLSVIFHTGSLSDPAIWQNLLILAAITLVVVVAGIQLFKRTEFR